MPFLSRRPAFILAALAATTLGACGSGNDAAAPDAPTAGPDAQDVETPAETTAATEAQSATSADEAATDSGQMQTAVPAAAADDGDPCTLTIRAGDNIAYSTNTLSAPASCSQVSVTLTHTGKLPAAAMGHNWVLVAEGDVESVAMAGMSSGLEGNYLPGDDERVIAATDIVGGGDSDTVTFSLDALGSDTNYVYVCTFPGHWSIMKGTFTVTR